MTVAPIRIGVSRCLLGEAVRFDGEHRRDQFLSEIVGQYVEWVPVCPEVEAGLGTPREPMRLAGAKHHPTVLTVRTKQDKTRLLERFSERRTRTLQSETLSGFVFKARSPSCGTHGVPLTTTGGRTRGTTSGLFARTFMEKFPLVPVADEDDLRDPVPRHSFFERAFSHRRCQNLCQDGITTTAIVQFHTAHKYQLMAHSRPHYAALSRLVGQIQA